MNQIACPGRKGGEAKKEVLKEEEYIACLSAIIERDYFPELCEMRERINENQKFRDKIALPTSVTESSLADDSPTSSNLPSLLLRSSSPESLQDLSVEQFLSRYTSEDNYDFNKLQQKTLHFIKKRYPWAYVDEEKLCLQNDVTLQQQIATHRCNAAVMQYPQAAELTTHEAALLQTSGNEIDKASTRLSLESKEKDLRSRRKDLQNATSTQPFIAEKRVGVDGLEIGSTLKDQEGHSSYALLPCTPVPHFRDAESPLMTWGEVMSTPHRLPDTSAFKMPEMTTREKIADSLTAQMVRRQSREKRRKQAYRDKLFSPSANCSPFSSPANLLSPSAKLLMKRALGTRTLSQSSCPKTLTPATAASSPITSPYSPSCKGSRRGSTLRASQTTYCTCNAMNQPEFI